VRAFGVLGVAGAILFGLGWVFSWWLLLAGVEACTMGVRECGCLTLFRVGLTQTSQSTDLHAGDRWLPETSGLLTT